MSLEKLCLEDDISFWNGTFLGDMLIFRGVSPFKYDSYGTKQDLGPLL